MTIRQAIELADNLCPNMYEDELKKQWLGILDGQIFEEVWKTHEDCPMETFTGYADASDDTELLVPFPYAQDVYKNYLQMQIHLENGENGRYNAAAMMFDVAYQAYTAKYNREHMPVSSGKRFRF